MTAVRKYRIYPTKEQQSAILQTCGCCRVVYNTCIEAYNTNYNNWVEQGKPQGEMDGKLPTPKELQENDKPWMKYADALALCNAKMAFMLALNAFFASRNGKRKGRKVGFPKFKTRHKSKFAYQTCNQGGNIRFDKTNQNIKLPKLGWVRIVKHRPLPENGTIKRVTVSMTKAGEFYVTLNIDCPKQPPLVNKHNHIAQPKTIGLDMSLPLFCVPSEASDDTRIKYEHNYRKEEHRITNLSKALSRKQHYKHVDVDGEDKKVEGENYRKARKRLAKVHAKIARRRENFLINTALYFVREYDVVCIEDLDMQAMSKTLRLGKSVMDLGWGKFVHWLEWEGEKYDTYIYKVDKWYPSSKTCNGCGYVNKELTLSDREWVCPCCGKVIDRDRNAAMNLRDKFLSKANDFRRNFGVVKRACGENANTLRETYEQVFSLKQEIQKEASESLVWR